MWKLKHVSSISALKSIKIPGKSWLATSGIFSQREQKCSWPKAQIEDASGLLIQYALDNVEAAPLRRLLLVLLVANTFGLFVKRCLMSPASFSGDFYRFKSRYRTNMFQLSHLNLSICRIFDHKWDAFCLQISPISAFKSIKIPGKSWLATSGIFSQPESQCSRDQRHK